MRLVLPLEVLVQMEVMRVRLVLPLMVLPLGASGFSLLGCSISREDVRDIILSALKPSHEKRGQRPRS